MKKQKHFLHRFTVRQDHRALVYRNGKLVEVLAEGKHRIWDPSRTVEIVHVDRRATRLQVEDLRHVAQSGLLDNDSHRIELSEHERGILRIDGQITDGSIDITHHTPPTQIIYTYTSFPSFHSSVIASLVLTDENSNKHTNDHDISECYCSGISTMIF